MSGGNKSQRTKGNLKPSSSSRAAEYLQQEGRTGFIGFSGLAGNSYGYVPQGKEDGLELDGEIRMLLRKMTKKDAVTKLKTIQEFTVLCKEKDSESIIKMLTFWPRIYNKLSNDFDHRVREAAQQAHHQMVTKAGRNLAPHLKQLIVSWLLSHFDTFTPAAIASKTSFDEVFPDKKKKEVLLFCKSEVVETVQRSILHETMDSLSDPKIVPVEERESKYDRFISSCFLVLKYIFENLHDKLAETDENLVKLFKEKTFWKFSKNKSGLIRNAFYLLISACCKLTPIYLQPSQISPALLLNIDEQEPVAVKAFWEAMLVCLSTFESSWEYVNCRKGVLPKFWKLLKNAGFGSTTVVYPNLLPFLSQLKPEVVGDGVNFYQTFLKNLFEGLRVKQDTMSISDFKLIMSAYMECLIYLVSSNQEDSQVTDFLIQEHLSWVLNEVFHTPNNQRFLWFGVFFLELKKFMNHIYDQASSGNQFYSVYQDELWKVITSAIVVDKKEFKSHQKNFYDSLIDFIFCICLNSKSSFKSNTVVLNTDVVELYDKKLLVFLQDVFSCYVNKIFGKKCLDVCDHFIDILNITVHIDVLKFILRELASITGEKHEIEDVSDIEICSNFTNKIVYPMFTINQFVRNQKLCKLAVGIYQVVSVHETQNYLHGIFKENEADHKRLLSLLSELFKYQDDKHVKNWLISHFIQSQILSLRTSDNDMSEFFILQWKILETYVSIIKESISDLQRYADSLLKMIGTFIQSKKKNPGTDDIILKCFITLCNEEITINDVFVEISLVIFESSVEIDASDIYSKAIASITHKIMNCQEEKWFQLFCQRISFSVKKFVASDIDMDRLCQPVQMLMQSAQSFISASGSSYHILLFQNLVNRDYDLQVNQNVNKFYLKLLDKMVFESVNVECLDKEIINLILKCLDHNEEETNHLVSNLLQSCTFLYKDLLDDAITRSVRGDGKKLNAILKSLKETEHLTEDVLDHCLMKTSPELNNSDMVASFCLVLSFLDDVSCIRAYVVKYLDILESDVEVKNDCVAFASLIKLLTSTLTCWFDVNNTDQGPEDYFVTITTVLDFVMVWKEEHSDWLLFSSTLSDHEPNIITFNANFVTMLVHFTNTSCGCFRSEHWDFVLCGIVSWLQTCAESFANSNFRHEISSFLGATFQLYCTISNVLSVWLTSNPFQPRIELQPRLLTPSSSSYKLDLLTEWREFFAPTAAKCLLNIYKKTVQGNIDCEISILFNLCASIQFISAENVKEFIFDGIENDKKKKVVLENVLKQSFKILMNGNWYMKISEYQLLTRLADMVQHILCEDVKNADQEVLRNFPGGLIETMEESRDEILAHLSSQHITIHDPLQHLTDEKEKSALLTYLLSWQVILNLFKMAASNQRASFANYFHKNNHVYDLITCLFCILPTWSTNDDPLNRPVAISRFDYSDLQKVAFYLLTSAMECIPALVRFWFNNNTNRKDMLKVDRYVSTFVTPFLLKNEFRKLEESSKEFTNMVVKTRPVAREVAAIYTVDEISMELIVQLSANHPLSPVSVECAKRIGVSNQLWRLWMLQLHTFLSFQNGSILDGLGLWRKNVDKRFDGVEECMVCFSVIHGSNYSLPSIGCKTCKKKFHPVCLYTWFSKSGKSTCPLCRNIF